VVRELQTDLLPDTESAIQNCRKMTTLSYKHASKSCFTLLSGGNISAEQVLHRHTSNKIYLGTQT